MSQVVLITGASSGFGRLAAETLAKRGHIVFATMRDVAGRNQAHAKELLALAQSEALRLQVLTVDVTDDSSVESAAEQALRDAGRIDVAINNAGFPGIGVTEAYTPAQFQSMFDVDPFA
jgi:NAD(P)-dependent dehydrogenase (short-subunit alcohol dehydrogenase family)